MTGRPYLLDGVRTAFGKYRGSLSKLSATDLGAEPVRELLRRHPAEVAPLDGVLFGVVLQGGLGQNPARVAALRGGVSPRVPASTLNSVCPSGLDTVCDAARRVAAGEGRRYLVGGFDSMSTASVVHRGDGEKVNLMTGDGLTCSLTGRSMGEIGERGNAARGISRQEQDAWALRSHRRAAAYAEHAEREITPVMVDGTKVDADECVRRDTDTARLAALRPVFDSDAGTVTAGNASALADGACAGLVGDLSAAEQCGAEPLARIAGWAAVAGPDGGLHEQPGAAVRALLDRHALRVSDIDLFEINEAFAGVVLAAVDELGLPDDVVNVNGGAIAVGHPLGGTGFRLLLTLALQLRETGARRGVATMCGGGGQGLAVLLERDRVHA